MPITFVSATIAVVAMSGLPPLTGFGGKWLLLSAMMEKGWYGPAILTLLATFVGFLYMARFINVVFLGPRKAAYERLTEAPLTLLVPQYLLVAGILLMSFFPKLLIDPVSKAIDPHFSSTLVWQGMSLEMIYGYWNPVPVMVFASAVSAILFGIVWLLGRSGIDLRISKRSRASFADFYQPMFTKLAPPWADAFWKRICTDTLSIAERTRMLYTGNGQVYNFYILYYFLVLYVACGSLRYLQTGA